MPEEVEIKVKHLYLALGEALDWIATIRTTLGSLDPEMVVRTDVNRCAPVETITPKPVPQLPVRGLCWPNLKWSSPEGP